MPSLPLKDQVKKVVIVLLVLLVLTLTVDFLFTDDPGGLGDAIWSWYVLAVVIGIFSILVVAFRNRLKTDSS